MKILLLCSFVLFVAGGSFLVLHKTSNPVAAAIVEYHSQKHQTVKIKSIGYRQCSEYAPDSLRFFAIANKALSYGKEASQYYNTRKECDSLLTLKYQLWPKALSLQSNLKSKGKGRDIFTRCNYIATITTDKEQFTDTLTVILNDKMRVAWPD